MESDRVDGEVVIREVTRDDIDDLVDLNKLAYPGKAEGGGVWGRTHLLTHLRVFPQGQLVACIGEEVVGAVSSLIVDMGPDPLRPHTWAGITDSGYFTNHNPKGDTLYGGDVYVHPDRRRKGIGAALYEARRELCRRLNLRRILAGGRLHNYSEYAERYTPEEFAERVVRGDLYDPALNFQLREGFELRGILPNYLHDPRSRNFASLIEWLNPDYKPSLKGSRKVRIACVQYQMRKLNSFEDFAGQVTYFVDIAAGYGSDFVLLPEFLSVQLLSQTGTLTPQEGIRKLAELTPRFKDLMQNLASRFGLTVIAGSHPVKQESGQLFNTCFVCLPDGKMVAQPKLHITPNESKWWQIEGGDTLEVINTPKAKIAVLICYDVEFPEAARYLADEGVDIIFVPFCTDNRQGYLRVRYCAQARAIENQIYLALAGNVGNLPDVLNMDVQYGQAAVLTPSDFAFARDAIAAEADYNEETVLVCDVDLDDLHEARTHGTVTPRQNRRNDLFTYVANFREDDVEPVPRATEPGEGPLGL
ncbi:MAG: GNAT family N-acetyltransferase [Opitutales bacterium]